MMCRRTWLAGLARVAAFIALGAGGADAGSLITTRAGLVTALGGPGTIEDFEKFQISDNQSTTLGNQYLDSTVVRASQGPGLVVGGVQFFGDEPAASLQWNGRGYFGFSSKTLADTASDLFINFTSAQAFGVDLEQYTGFPDTVTYTVFARDGTTILATGDVAVVGPTPVFFGYSDPGGIGGVEFSADNNGFSPAIDNLEFGTLGAAVPEPSSFVEAGTATVMVLLASAWRSRRKVTAP